MVDLMTTGQVAQRLGVSPERVRQLAREGRLLPSEVTSLGRLWARETVDAFRNQRGPYGRYPGAARAPGEDAGQRTIDAGGSVT